MIGRGHLMNFSFLHWNGHLESNRKCTRITVYAILIKCFLWCKILCSGGINADLVDVLDSRSLYSKCLLSSQIHVPDGRTNRTQDSGLRTHHIGIWWIEWFDSTFNRISESAYWFIYSLIYIRGSASGIVIKAVYIIYQPLATEKKTLCPCGIYEKVLRDRTW